MFSIADELVKTAPRWSGGMSADSDDTYAGELFRRYTRIHYMDETRCTMKTPSANTLEMIVKADNEDNVEYIIGDPQRFMSISYNATEKCSYPSGSTYQGGWDSNGWDGDGEYTYPHGVKYIGEFEDGMQSGHGVLVYPMGQRLKGKWRNDKLTSWTYTFSDGGEYMEPWRYCMFPDRRYTVSVNEGLLAPGKERITSEVLARVIPNGCFDVGEGFYNPKIRCIISAYEPHNIIRIPNRDEEMWIINHCRKEWDSPVGYRPDLYEYWCTGTQKSVNNVLSSVHQRSAHGEGLVKCEDMDEEMTEVKF